MSKDKKKKNQQSSNNSNFVFSIVLFAISFLLYANTIGHDYALDDYMLIKENRFTKAGFDGIGDILTSDMFAGHMEGYKADLSGGRYRPLSQVTLSIEHEIFGLNPHISHFVNAVLFAITPVLIFLVLNLLLKENIQNSDWIKSLPFLAALLFSVHPIHTEVVANIKGRDEIMSLLLVLISFYYFIKYFDFNIKKDLILSLIAFFFALLSKENAITYLAVLPLSIIMFRNTKITDSLKQIIPHIIVAILFIIIRQSIVGGAKVLAVPELMNDSFVGMDFSEKFGTIFITLINYIKLLIIPYPLTYDYYPYHIPKTDLLTILPIVSIVLHLGLVYLAFILYKSKPIVSFSIFYYFITLSIVSNIPFTIGSFMNERFVYMPSIAVSIALAWIISQYITQILNNKKLALGLVLVIAGAYSFITVSRNPVWKDNYTLMTSDVNTSQNSAFGNYGAGVQYYLKLKDEKELKVRKEIFEKGTKHLYKAIEIHPRYANAFVTLGNTYFEYDPKSMDSTLLFYTKAYEVYPGNYDVSLNLGRLHRDFKKDLNAANVYFQNCIRVNQQKWEAYLESGVIYFNMGKFTEALNLFESAYARNNQNPQIIQNLAAAYEATGNNDKAMQYKNLLNKFRK